MNIQGELAWVTAFDTEMEYPRTVTHPSTNRARCTATMLTETNALALSQIVTRPTIYAGITKNALFYRFPFVVVS